MALLQETVLKYLHLALIVSIGTRILHGQETELYPGLIITSPNSHTVMESNQTVSFYCMVSGISLLWTVNGMHADNFLYRNSGVTYTPPTHDDFDAPFDIYCYLNIPANVLFDNVTVHCQAFGTNGTNEISDPVTFTVLKVPEAPSVSITNSSDNITLSWTQYSDYHIANYSVCIRPATGTGADGTLTSCACVETTEEEELVFSLQWHHPCAVSCESYAFTVSATNVLGTEGEKSEPVVGMFTCKTSATDDTTVSPTSTSNPSDSSIKATFSNLLLIWLLLQSLTSIQV